VAPTNTNSSSPLIQRGLFIISLLLIVIRLATLAFPDLVDTTEGRYAGVAQIMLERDDWVTPWIHYEGINQPYLGKPVLHFWLIQVAYLIFGENNFSARLPGVISALAIAAAISFGLRRSLSQQAILVTLAVFASSCMTFFLSGAVLLDVTLTLGVTVALLGFIQADRDKLPGYLAFVGLAVGIMTKGPLACILVGCVLAPWSIAHRLLTGEWPRQLRRTPWIPGSLLMLVIVSPWYLWAEVRNPGFLDYFIWTENFGRYLHKDYVDEYGSGHRQPFGAAIGMMILAVFPWSLIVAALTIKRIKVLFSRSTIKILANDPLLLFALCWSFSTTALLLGAKQYTATYLMPSVPGFALLVGILWERNHDFKLVSKPHLERCLKLSIYLIIAIWGIVSLAALRFNTNLYILILSLVGLAAATGFVRIKGRKLSPYAQLIVLTVTVSLTYASATLCYNNYISDNRSSRRVLQLARKLLSEKDKGVKIGFPYYFPFSAYFYTPKIFGPGSVALEIEAEHLATADVDLMIIRKRNAERLKADLPQFKELGAQGQWRIFGR
jgi:4-amino-4-deoxy-L-arabinose transferase-like glycosyltransferase